MKPLNAKRYEELLKSEYPDLYALRKQRKRKMIRSILIYELLFALFSFGAYDYIIRSIEMNHDTDIILKAVIFGIAAMIIPPFLFKSTLDMLSPTWVGTIVSVKYEMRYPQSNDAFSRYINRSHPQEYMKMRIETDKKKKTTISLRSHMNSALQQGDRIVKFRGFVYPTEISEVEKLFVCIVCGKVVKKEVCKCPSCLHSIVDLHTASLPKDIWAEFY